VRWTRVALAAAVAAIVLRRLAARRVRYVVVDGDGARLDTAR